MLTKLSIKNYALIDHLKVEFSDGLTIITGETGAGKSILLGGLSLVLGKRADLNSLKNTEEKCVIEAEFAVKAYQLEAFFKEEDLDYEPLTIVRREILPSGKSRAFVNDTPVRLDALSKLGDKLIDVHSQHQTLQLTDNSFQFQVIDAVANNKANIKTYHEKLSQYHEVKRKLQKSINFQQEADKEHDYNVFLLKELQEAKLVPGILTELEATYEKLNNVEEIREKLALANQLINEEQIGVVTTLNELKSTMQKLSGYGKQFENMSQRVQSVFLEIDDIQSEILSEEESLDADPALLEETATKLQQIYNLQKKHSVLEITELIQLQQTLEEQVAVTENIEADIKALQLKVLAFEEELDVLALKINKERLRIVPQLTNYLQDSLADLGMQNARFNIQISPTDSYFYNGKDELQFLFSANKGTAFGELKKVASGGELSRIMLSIKAILAQYENLPTIMFDEIDTGVSGDVSNKMGEIMKAMSTTMQVFAITHLPQVAAKGNVHFKVFKEDVNGVTTTQIKELTYNERVDEIAEMLSGRNVTEAAITHAKELLL
ncbi:DNA repair protein RecN [Zhouia sp. PK063]|uniref:DNA repair protein RecN n=1 Tax=Zhouia sp. PK063 TaxID=3373602 RepID=UPI0037B6023C